jgi:hypothetical protein
VKLIFRFGPILLPLYLMNIVTLGCVSFEAVMPSKVEHYDQRPLIAILPFKFDLPISRVATLKTVDKTPSREEEILLVKAALQEIGLEGRWLLMSRLATGGGFRFVPIEQVDALRMELEIEDGALPTRVQLAMFRQRLGADLVIVATILDYGKIRWQWLMAGFLIDVSWETVAFGIATG